MTALSERHRVARQLREIDPHRRPGRKTNRTRKPVTPTHEAPELRLAFLLPPALAFALSEGDQGGGIELGPLNNVAVTLKTFNRDRLFENAARWLRRVIPKGMPPMSFAATMTSSNDHAARMKWWLAVVDGHVFATISPVGPLIFPAPPN